MTGPYCACNFAYYIERANTFLNFILDQISECPEKINCPFVDKIKQINDTIILINAAILESGATEILADLAAYDKRQAALCENYETATPHMSVCARCPVIAAAPDGCGYMCGLNLRAVEDSDFNADNTECLAMPKINPLGGSSGITGGVDL